MTSSPVADTVTRLVAPIVSGLDLDLYDLEFSGGVLRITVDTPVGSAGGVTLDQLALVNRLVGRDLDHHDPITGHYTLEVSSPGLERNLRTPAHFQREVGKTVAIRLRALAGGERRLQGVLIAADDHSATVGVDNGGERTERVIPLDSIDRARTVFQWKGAAKPGKKAPGAKPSKDTTRPKQTSRRTPGAGGVKPAPGPSDELDSPTSEEATA